jgi:undecaprenyl diphosphate synthase
MSDTKQSILPRHIAIIMDGNGRWAKARNKIRTTGHKAGAKAARELIENSVRLQIEVLSLFAFSSENWQRPEKEVNTLMELFFSNLVKELPTFKKHQIQVRVIGDLDTFSTKLRNKINDTMTATAEHQGLKLVIVASYGGRWDITQAVKKLSTKVANKELEVDAIDEEMISKNLCLADLPEPNLFIRTSGEQRISNFMIWQLAYTELYFTEELWPDFNSDSLNKALDFYKTRQRRFGLTGEQVA